MNLKESSEQPVWIDLHGGFKGNSKQSVTCAPSWSRGNGGTITVARRALFLTGAGGFRCAFLLLKHSSRPQWG